MFVYFRPKFIGIFILSMICGLPLALAASTLTVMLTEAKLDISTIGLFALVGLPYSLKYLWAPLVDNTKLPILNKFGRRKSWLVLCQALTAISIFSVALIDINDQLHLVALAGLAIAFFSVTHDIVFDAFRIESLTPEEQAAGVSIYVFGYRLGMLVSSGGALYIAHFYSWELTYMIMAALMLTGILTTLLMPEPKVKVIKLNVTSFLEWLKNSYIEPLAEFAHRVNLWQVLLFVTLFKLGDAYAGMMTNTFLLHLGFSKIEIANIVKGIGLGATLFGVFIGGLAAAKLGMYRCLFLSLILQIASNLLFIIQVYAGNDAWVLTGVICIENFTGGVGTSIFTAYLALLCNARFTATQYALLASFALLGRTLISGTSGFVIEAFGWENFFIISALLSVPALFLIQTSTGKKVKTT